MFFKASLRRSLSSLSFLMSTNSFSSYLILNLALNQRNLQNCHFKRLELPKKSPKASWLSADDLKVRRFSRHYPKNQREKSSLLLKCHKKVSKNAAKFPSALIVFLYPSPFAISPHSSHHLPFLPSKE